MICLAGTGVSTQGLTLVKRALYHLRHSPQPFFAWVIFHVGSYDFAQSCPQIVIRLHTASLITGITGTGKQVWLIEMGVSLTFFLGWPGANNLSDAHLPSSWGYMCIMPSFHGLTVSLIFLRNHFSTLKLLKQTTIWLLTFQKSQGVRTSQSKSAMLWICATKIMTWKLIPNSTVMGGGALCMALPLSCIPRLPYFKTGSR